MSYILEALKKLEQRRQQENGTILLTFQGTTLQPTRRRGLWLGLFAAVLILNGALLFWWVGPWRTSEKGVPAPQKTAPPVAAATIATEERKQSVPTQTENKKAVPPEETKGTILQSAAERARETALPKAEPAPPPPSRGPRPYVRQDQQTGTGNKEGRPPADGRILKRPDLPANVAGSLPEIKMALHYYIADPKSRFARINDKTLREGQFLSEGLKVEEINPVGVVMSYQGYKFQIGISENQGDH